MIKTVKKRLARVLDLYARKAGYRKPSFAYQDKKFTDDQLGLIKGSGCLANVKSSLEIGCNKGNLVKKISDEGVFAVGVDLKPYWAFSDTGSAILGVAPIDENQIQKIPGFDAIFLLSVHHQWVAAHGDEYAMSMINRIFSKAQVCMYIEFAAIADKYKYKHGSSFVDNDERSIIAYADGWLRSANLGASHRYLGKVREVPNKEPYRYMWVVER